MACKDCNSSIINNSKTLIPQNKCNPPCPEVICPVGYIQSGCVVVDSALSCSNTKIDESLTDVLIAMDNKICSCCNPSGNDSVSGIIYNDNIATRIAQVSTQQTLKTFNNNYLASSSLTTKDTIDIQFTGRFSRQSADGNLTLKLTIANGASTIKDILVPIDFVDVLYPYVIDLSINVTGSSSALVTGTLIKGDDNSYNGFSTAGVTGMSFYSRLTGLNFSNLTVSANFIMADVGNINDGYADSLTVQVKKKI